ncbi:Glycosyltransferase involved in cell wall bisynthesis [Lachnospiraceae bacterium NK3A20]|nr:Glycosyltransferase involved in cell wall bisynthesis [Lachnospiraceae bacterium NK3A20]
MKNVMLIIPMLHQGGLENVCVQTARLLAPYCRVTLLVFTYKDKFFDVFDLDVVNIEIPARAGKLRKAWNLLRRVRAIRRVKRERGIDITYSFGATANLANVFARVGDKILTGFRSSVDLDNERQVNLFGRRSDLVVCCTKDIAGILNRKFGYHNTAVLYNPLDATGIQGKLQAPAPDVPFADNTAGRVLVSIGRDDDYKGYWHLIKAVAILHEDPAYRDVKLSLIGSGDYRDYRTLAEGLGIAEDVAFPGVKENPFPYVKNAAAFILPSNHEGFPNALAEGMAAGLPVMACDCLSGPREILLSEEEYDRISAAHPDSSVTDSVYGAYGVLVPNMRDVKDTNPSHITEEDRTFAGEIKEFLSDKERLQSLSERAAKRSLSFSAKAYTESLVEMLERL